MARILGRASMGAAFVLVVGACSTSEPLGLGGKSNGNNATTQAE
jgi:hypothetical protein